MMDFRKDFPESQDFQDQLLGVGKFRDTGRKSSGMGESLDSVIGAPARVAVEQAQKGNISWDAVQKIFRQIGADPKTAPTGYDIASKVTDDPMIGTFLASAVDFGAQMPGIAHITPGVVGEVRGVKNMGKVADAVEAFAERGKAPLSTEAKIAQMNGATGEVRDAMPDLISRASNEKYMASQSGSQAADMNADLLKDNQRMQRSAYDNPKNAPPAPEAPYVKPEPQTPDGPQVTPPEKYRKIGDSENVLRANDMNGPGVFSNYGARDAPSQYPDAFFNKGGYSPEAIKAMESIANRYGQDAPAAVKAMKAAAESDANHLPYVGVDVHGVKKMRAMPFPNFGADPTGVIGESRIQGMSAAAADPFSWMDMKYGAAKDLLRKHAEAGIAPEINTSSDLIAHDDYINALPDGTKVNMHMLSPDESLNRILYPGNPSQRRLESAAKTLQDAGVSVNKIYPTVEKFMGDVQHAYPKGTRWNDADAYNGLGITHEELVKKLQESGLLTDADKAAGVLPLSRKPDSLSAATVVNPGDASRVAGSSSEGPSREEKIAFLQAQQGSAPKTREEKIAFLQAQANKPPPQAGMAQTALEGFGNGASMGYLPQMQAAAAGPIYSGLNAITGQDVQPDSYVDERDRNIARQAQQGKDNYYTQKAANLAGGITAGLAMTPLMPARAATIGGRIMQAGRIGGVMGAVANPGDKQGQVDYSGQIPQRMNNAAMGSALGAVLGTAVESPGIARNVLNGTQKTLANRVGSNVEFTPVENRGQIENAAETAGIKDIPKALLTDNPTFQKLESGLAQSGSLPAKSIRDQYNNFFKSLETASKKVSDLKTNDSDFALGKGIQNSMQRQVEDAKAPVSEMYNELTPHLRKINVDEEVVNKAFGALKRNPLFQTKDGIEMLNEYKASTLQQPELASLKEFRSTLRDSVGPSSPPLEAKRMDAIASAVTSVRNNTINALKEHMPEHMHPEVDNLISDIALADAAHKSNLDDLNSVKSLVGNKPVTSQSGFLNKLSEMKESDLADRASNLDVTTLRNLQKKYPPVFDKAKTAIVNDMVKGSTSSVNGFNDTAFLKKYDGLDQEMKDLIFEPKMQSHIEAVKTIKQAIPDKLGPSGTPEGKMMMDMFLPRRNALDYGVKKTLEATSKVSPAGASEFSDVLPQHSPAKTALQLILSRPSVANQAASSPFQKAADANLKGEDKWANDGAKKLIDHAPDDKATIEKAKGAMSDPKIKTLLIQASDLKPGTPAMEKTMAKLKAKIASDD